MPAKRLYTALFTVALLFYTPLLSAEIFKWVDANGETHFSDKPPRSAPTKVTQKKPIVKRVVNRPVRNKVVAKRVKPQKSVVSRPKQVARLAQTYRAKKTKRPVKAVRRAAPQVATKKPALVNAKKRNLAKRPHLLEDKQRPDKPQYASILTASLSAAIYDIERIAEPKKAQFSEAEERVLVTETEPEPEQPQATVITNVKQSLCKDNRKQLAILSEKGFEYYYDDAGDLRVAWGVEGFYRQKQRYLSDIDVARKTKKVLFEIEQYCDQPLDTKNQAQVRADWIRSEYCDVSRVILTDLKHPFMRTSDRDIQDQEQEMIRFCSEYPANKYRNDERYYPKSLQVKRLQQKHFLYR